MKKIEFSSRWILRFAPAQHFNSREIFLRYRYLCYQLNPGGNTKISYLRNAVKTTDIVVHRYCCVPKTSEYTFQTIDSLRVSYIISHISLLGDLVQVYIFLIFYSNHPAFSLSFSLSLPLVSLLFLRFVGRSFVCRLHQPARLLDSYRRHHPETWSPPPHHHHCRQQQQQQRQQLFFLFSSSWCLTEQAMHGIGRMTNLPPGHSHRLFRT